jgi:hypothetical protein
MNTVYNVSYKDRMEKQKIQEEVLVEFTYEATPMVNKIF